MALCVYVDSLTGARVTRGRVSRGRSRVVSRVKVSRDRNYRASGNRGTRSSHGRGRPIRVRGRLSHGRSSRIRLGRGRSSRCRLISRGRGSRSGLGRGKGSDSRRITHIPFTVLQM